MKAENTARYADHDRELRQRDAAILAVDRRLTRIEAQLEYLINNPARSRAHAPELQSNMPAEQ